jgi:hypothetical protein
LVDARKYRVIGVVDDGSGCWAGDNSSGQTIYMVVHDAPVAASIWQGNWAQINSTGVAIPAGEYMLYVDTSVGTLSDSFQVCTIHAAAVDAGAGLATGIGIATGATKLRQSLLTATAGPAWSC